MWAKVSDGVLQGVVDVALPCSCRPLVNAVFECFHPFHSSHFEQNNNGNDVLLQYLLLTDNDEKVPNTAACPSGVADPQCSPGLANTAVQLLMACCQT